ncbi:hypothetical protein L1987_01560 [Smallanthus sonchifolius]|uniref:Uncharacterized protein n=1 Tax=Smallanthus sonchifolius TaxID=185202 RepID=A0ACB9K5F4_9ASTR|nr:hypothetical protein L1987_01560 [Smallanthus sonchifolius]
MVVIMATAMVMASEINVKAKVHGYYLPSNTKSIHEWFHPEFAQKNHRCVSVFVVPGDSAIELGQIVDRGLRYALLHNKGNNWRPTQKACEIFQLNLEQVSIWDYFSHRKHALMNDMDKTLDDANIQMDQDVVPRDSAIELGQIVDRSLSYLCCEDNYLLCQASIDLAGNSSSMNSRSQIRENCLQNDAS